MEPVKTFWVELCGRWRATYQPKADPTQSVDLGTFDTREQCDEATRRVWDSGLAYSSGSIPLYRLADGREVASNELPPGATFDADWEHEYRTGPDGLSIYVVCPDSWRWGVDSRASNCTLPEDKLHRCWCRHGDPKTGALHVDKVGLTCQAGAGSIQTPTWHGFLTNGVLRESR